MKGRWAGGRFGLGCLALTCLLWACSPGSPLPQKAAAWQAAQSAWDRGEWEEALESLEEIEPGQAPYGELARTWRLVLAAGLADGHERTAALLGKTPGNPAGPGFVALHRSLATRFRDAFLRNANAYEVTEQVILPFGFPRVSAGIAEEGSEDVAGDPKAVASEQVDAAVLGVVLDVSGSPDVKAALGKFKVREVRVPGAEFARFLSRYGR